MAAPTTASISTSSARHVLLKSGLVGVFATATDIILLVLLVDVLGWPATSANVPALSVGLLIQFLGNKYFAFEDRRSDAANLLRQGALFALVEVAAFGLSAALFHGLVTSVGTHHLVARLFGSALVYFCFSLPLWRLVFRTPPPQNDGGYSC